jgi:hypothetical protein
MGQAIHYCFRCSEQLREAQFEKRKAFRVDGWVTCAACAPELLKTLPADRAAVLQDLMAGKERKPSSATPPPLRDSRLSITPAAFPPAGGLAAPRPKWPFLAGAGLAVAAILAAVLMTGRGTPPREPTAAPTSTGHSGLRPPPHPRPVGDSPERQLLKRAQQYAREHPDDLEGQLREFGDLSLLSDKTEVGAEARRTVEALQVRERDLVAQGMALLNGEIDAPLQREDFGAVNRTLHAAKARSPGTQWKLAVERRQGEVAERIKAALQPLKEKACVAKAAGKQAELDAILQKVRSWEGKYFETLNEALAGVQVLPSRPAEPKAEPPARSPEAKAYLVLWEQAMAKAAARDYAGAAADLERGAGAPKEDAVKQELAQDLRDLKELDRLYDATTAAQAAARNLALETVDGRKISGRVLAADVDRVELVVTPGKPTLFVEWADVTAPTLAALFGARKAEPRLLGLFRLLEGDPEGMQDAIDPKYGAFAPSARAKALKPGADELSARDVFYDAERGFRSMATREKALEGYRQLKQKFKDTALVKRAAARIDRRLESGKEYYFLAADLSAGGTFSLTKEGRYESLADADASKPNWVEWEFLALPSTTYRCWALVGGCCAEAFTFHYQASGLTELNPKTKKRAPAEPGGELASPVKHSLKNLKPSHPKGEPQKPTRWEWIEIVLPRSSAAGVKQVRLLTDLKGFGVAAVLVSSTKSKAPTEPEAAELVKARVLDAVPSWFASKSGGIPRLLLDDFDQGVAGWGFHNGAEFKGAKGGVVHDPAVGHDQKGSLKLSADFTGGGAYVSTGRNLPAGADVREVRFWVKAENPAHIGIRVGDGSDQCLQKPMTLAATRDWQEVVLTFEKFNGAEHWGGANDGKLHTPVKNFHICISVSTFGGAKSGDVWIDDVEGILNSDSPEK